MTDQSDNSLIELALRTHDATNRILTSLKYKNAPLSGNEGLYDIPELIDNLSGWLGPGNPNYSCIIKFIFNDEGTDYEVPATKSELENMLKDAYVEITPHTQSGTYKFSINSIKPTLPTYCEFAIPHETTADVKFVFGKVNGGTQYYGCYDMVMTIAPNQTYTVHVQTKKMVAQNSVTFYERVQMRGSGSNVPWTSYKRKRVIDTDGTTHTYFGGFLQDQTTWIDKSQMSMKIYSCIPDEDGGVLSAIPTLVYDGGGGDLNDMGEVFKNEFDLHKVTVVVKTPNSDISNDMMTMKPVYTRTYTEDVEFPTYNNVGEIVGSKVKECIVTSITSSPNQVGYHIHSAFTKAIRNRETNELSIVEQPRCYFGCYRASGVTVRNPENTQNITLYTSRATNGYPTTSNKEYNNIFMTNNNLYPMEIHDTSTGEDVVTYYNEPDTTNRRFTPCMTFDLDLHTLLNYILFGCNAPSVLHGITDSTRERTLLGETKFMLDNGYYWGAVNDASVTNPIISFGLEDSTYSSMGIQPHNIDLVNTRFGSGSSDIKGEWLVCLDRTDVKPSSYDYDNLLANGYMPLSFNVTNSTNRRQGYDDRYGFRDMYMPVTNQDDDANITAGAIDTFWFGGFPSVQNWKDANVGIQEGEPTIPVRKWYNVGFSNARGGGSSLGLFSRLASRDLVYSDARGWCPLLVLLPA